MVSGETARADLIAGLTGAIIVLPQGVAFATIAGLPPEYGLYAAMAPAIVAALFGSSWHLVSGPTTAISIVVFASVSPLAEPGSPHFIALVLTLTFLTGVFQLIMGLARMGVLVNFISHTVVIGFTAGAAVLIAASQIKNFFGIDIPRGAHFYEILRQLILHVADLNPYVTSVAAVTLSSGILVKKFFPLIPYMIAAMLVGSFFALGLDSLFGAEATRIRTVGALPSHLPPLSWPDLSLATIKKMAPTALAVTMLALTEAVSISRAVAVRSEQRIDGNQEFVGQGLSNIVGSFLSAYASSGSFNRSGLNYAAGARTPLAAVLSAVFLAAALLLVAPLAAYLPIPAMAAILFLVAWGLIDFHHIRAIYRTSRGETAVLATTLLSTLFVELEFAIYVGVMLSLMLYLARTSQPALVALSTTGAETPHIVQRRPGPAAMPAVPYRAHQRLDLLRCGRPRAARPAAHRRDRPAAKECAHRWQRHQFRRRRRRRDARPGSQAAPQDGRRPVFLPPQDPVYRFLRHGDYLKDIGEGGFFPARSNVVAAVFHTLDPDICAGCDGKVFNICETKLPGGEERGS